jgi:hypothetical protein
MSARIRWEGRGHRRSAAAHDGRSSARVRTGRGSWRRGILGASQYRALADRLDFLEGHHCVAAATLERAREIAARYEQREPSA